MRPEICIRLIGARYLSGWNTNEFIRARELSIGPVWVGYLPPSSIDVPIDDHQHLGKLPVELSLSWPARPFKLDPSADIILAPGWHH